MNLQQDLEGGMEADGALLSLFTKIITEQHGCKVVTDCLHLETSMGHLSYYLDQRKQTTLVTLSFPHLLQSPDN